mmetsp:Transcript_27963/g.58021  ORF Transcript_27963/g.58021 Transcript_27963/m.58021 type:complete len:208 (-) Transcript_27963:204-827(-)
MWVCALGRRRGTSGLALGRARLRGRGRRRRWELLCLHCGVPDLPWSASTAGPKARAENVGVLQSGHLSLCPLLLLFLGPGRLGRPCAGLGRLHIGSNCLRRWILCSASFWCLSRRVLYLRRSWAHLFPDGLPRCSPRLALGLPALRSWGCGGGLARPGSGGRHQRPGVGGASRRRSAPRPCSGGCRRRGCDGAAGAGGRGSLRVITL